MDETTPNNGIDYEIRIKGHLSEEWSLWFEGLKITNCENGEGVLSGRLVDQSALQGILTRIGDLNLVLISVNPVMKED